MQSKSYYRDARLEVLVADEIGGDRGRRLSTYLGIPTDGRVVINYPHPDANNESGELHHAIPFRDHRQDGEWFGEPDNPKWRRYPIWEWTNPNCDPHEHITLNPSYGLQPDDGWELHCWIRDGEIDLL